MSYGNAFKDQYLNQAVDVDGFPSAQRFQCYDLWAKFLMDNYGLAKPIVLAPTGYAVDIWDNFDGLSLGQYFTKVNGAPQLGDWAIYGKAPATPDSHVGMFLQDNGNGTIKLLQQNAPLPKCTVGDLTKNGLRGYLRPKGGSNIMMTEDGVRFGYLAVTGGQPQLIPKYEDQVTYWTGRDSTEFNKSLYGLSDYFMGAARQEIVDLKRQLGIANQGVEFERVDVYVKKTN
jgi:hypothetical protein